MADDSQDISDYREAIEGLLLNGDELEAVFPAASGPTPDTHDPKAIAITSDRLIVCSRELKRSSSDEWLFRSIPYSQLQEVTLSRRENLRRDRIESESSVLVQLQGRGSADLRLQYHDPAVAREVHDRILAHMLAG